MNRSDEIAIELDCQKILSQYYNLVDKKEYEKAVQLFTPNIKWASMGVVLEGRDEVLEGLFGSLSDGTIRHVFTNTVITVIDKNHVVSRSYNTNYYARGIKFEDQKEAISFVGPHRLMDNYTDLVRTDDGWKILRRSTGQVFRTKPDELVGLEIWGEDAGKTTN